MVETENDDNNGAIPSENDTEWPDRRGAKDGPFFSEQRDQMCAMFGVDQRQLDEQLFIPLTLICGRPFDCDLVGTAELRLVRVAALRGLPRMRLYYRVLDPANIELVWIEVDVDPDEPIAS